MINKMTGLQQAAVEAANLIKIAVSLFEHKYVNLTTDPTQLLDAVGIVLNTTQQLQTIVQSTGLNATIVKQGLRYYYGCLHNKTMSNMQKGVNDTSSWIDLFYW